jgi:alpha-D-ribose 1-methylphosphonate 5-triphosphate synthase subunit PhnG
MGHGEDDISAESDAGRKGITVAMVNYGVYAGRDSDKERLENLLDQLLQTARAKQWNRIAF